MKILLFTTIVASVLITGYCQFSMFGKLPCGPSLNIVEQSPNYKNGAFQNLQAAPNTMNILKAAWYFIFGKKEHVTPVQNIPAIKTDILGLDIEKDILIWFGHSSYFIQIEGVKILVDPVFSKVASPVPFFPKAFKGTNIYNADDIPEIDYLIITHDHWDHLDHKTVQQLNIKVKHVFCPLGVGSHLTYWGFDNQKITEMDWENIVTTEKRFRIFCFPSKHFSGRGLVRNKTLWASFLIETPTFFRIFAGCDGGYDKHFLNIGNQFPSIDLAILENGQYNENWKHMHMQPEEVIQAAADLKAKSLLPIHMSKFALSTHPWHEPLYKTTDLGLLKEFKILTPMIGEKVELKNSNQKFSRWWEY